MKKLRVGFDLDGVMYDFGNSVRRYLDSIGRQYGFKDDEDEPHHWNFYEYWGMDLDEFKQICNDGADAGFIFSGPARSNAVWAAQAVKAAGHDIVIITDRQFGSTPQVSHKATFNWLSLHSIPFDEIYFSADKTCVQTDIFIEDKLQNYDSLVAVGTPCVLVNRPWNQEDDYRFRVDDIVEYPDIVQLASFEYSEHPLTVL